MAFIPGSQHIPNPQQILKTIAGSLPLWGGLETPETQSERYSSCPKPELSCQTKFDHQNTCCFNYPGGHFLQTQFWDADPAIGPDDSWTIHGLWYVQNFSVNSLFFASLLVPTAFTGLITATGGSISTAILTGGIATYRLS